MPTIDRSLIDKELAHIRRGNDITRGYVHESLPLEPDDKQLMALGGGLEAYKYVDDSDHVKAVFQQRQRNVISTEWTVTPASERRLDKKAADFIREELKRINFDDITEMMLLAILNGMSVGEVMWVRDSNLIRIADIKVRDYRRFSFDGNLRLWLKTQTQTYGQIMPDYKFWIVRAGKANSDQPYGLGLNRFLYWKAFFIRTIEKFWLKYLEKYSSPTHVGKYRQGLSDEEQKIVSARLLDALDAIQGSNSIALEEGQIIELLESSRSGPLDFQNAISHFQDQITRLILSQTATTQGTPGKLGNESPQEDVANAIAKADSDLICQSFNSTVAKWVTDFNFFGAGTPSVFRVFDKREDLNARATRDKTIFGMGFVPTLAYIKDVYGDGWEQKTAQQPASTPAASADKEEKPEIELSEPILLAEEAEDDDQPTSLTISEQLQDEIGAAFEAEALTPIRDLLDSVATLEEFKEKLVSLFDKMQRGRRADMIAKAMAVSELAGRDGIIEGYY